MELQESCPLNISLVIMPTADSSASKEVVTAALLVIGSKILSGRTKDQNVGYIAEYLTALGIDLKEVRVVAMRRERSSTQLRAGDAQKLAQAKREVEEMLERVRRAQSKSA